MYSVFCIRPTHSVPTGTEYSVLSHLDIWDTENLYRVVSWMSELVALYEGLCSPSKAVISGQPNFMHLARSHTGVVSVCGGGVQGSDSSLAG